MPLGLSGTDLFFLAGLPAITDTVNSLLSSNAAGRATDAQIAGNDRAAEIQRESQRDQLDFLGQIFNYEQQQRQPFYNTGLSALNELSRRTGLGSPGPGPSGPPSFSLRDLGTNPGPAGGVAPYGSGPGSGGPPVSTGPSGWEKAGRIAAGLAPLGLAGLAGAGGAGSGMGAIGGAMAGLASNPIGWAIAAGLGIGTPLLKSQAHHEANDWVQNYQNSFDQRMAEIDQAHASGQITGEQAQQLRAQSIANYATRANEWMTEKGDSSDRNEVIGNAFDTFNSYYGPNYGVTLNRGSGSPQFENASSLLPYYAGGNQ